MNYEKEEKELVWLPKSVAKQVQEVIDEKAKETVIFALIEDSKRDIQISLESLEDDVIQYKGAMIRARKAFEEAKNEQLTANYEMWEVFEKDLPSVEAKVQKMKEKIAPLKKELDELKTLMDSVRKYEIQDLLESVESVSRHLSYDGDTGKLLRFLFENYKK
jgi:chromosome segregation ATPase